MKTKKIDIIIIIILLIVISVSILLIIKYGKNYLNEIEVKEIVKQIKIDIINENVVNTLKFDNYDVLGIIKIDKINIEYPIIEEVDSKAMEKSIIKFWGPNINENGNLTLAGHSNKDGTMFGKLRKLEIGDYIEINSFSKQITYKILDKYIVTPNDVRCIESIEKDTKELTLITCINGNDNRLVVKAREI